MAERYLDLALVDRREVLDVAGSASGRSAPCPDDQPASRRSGRVNHRIEIEWKEVRH